MALSATKFVLQREVAFGVGTITQQLGLKGALGETLNDYSGTGSELGVAANLLFSGGDAPGLYIPPGKGIGPILSTVTGQRVENPQDLDIGARIDIDITSWSFIRGIGSRFSIWRSHFGYYYSYRCYPWYHTHDCSGHDCSISSH